MKKTRRERCIKRLILKNYNAVNRYMLSTTQLTYAIWKFQHLEFEICSVQQMRKNLIILTVRSWCTLFLLRVHQATWSRGVKVSHQTPRTITWLWVRAVGMKRLGTTRTGTSREPRAVITEMNVPSTTAHRMKKVWSSCWHVGKFAKLVVSHPIKNSFAMKSNLNYYDSWWDKISNFHSTCQK